MAARNIRAEFEIILSWMYKMEGEIESHLNQIRNLRMRDIDERIQLISSELLPSLVLTPDGSVSEADIRYIHMWCGQVRAQRCVYLK